MRPIEECRARAARLKLMIFDVDGTLTDGSLYFTDAGGEIKVFNAHDGHGMRMLQAAGVELAIITGRNAPCVDWRMKNLGIGHVYQGIGDKLATFHELLARVGVDAGEAGFMGDDLIDLRVMAACGFSAAPADCYAPTQKYADYLASRPGGRGAAREVCEFILAAQGKLDAALAGYLPAPSANPGIAG
ncbi:MAG: HAD family hydrolase [Candidatus Accumulibacter sp.]|jgi:3-deoxy-D-manno-octulosonate 8-phosphate phosphatase (KDO 8-P phosphatase)|nr:HAD family hydrolase [Accumulibacter sp.]